MTTFVSIIGSCNFLQKNISLINKHYKKLGLFQCIYFESSLKMVAITHNFVQSDICTLPISTVTDRILEVNIKKKKI